MRKMMALLAVTLFTGVQAWAACSNPCVKPCPPKMKWITVEEMVEVQVPVQTWVEEKQMVKYTEMQETQEQMNVKVNKTIWVDEEYDCYEYVTRQVEFQGTRKVAQKVCEMVEKTVKKTILVCCPGDPCNPCAKPKRVKQVVTETILVPVYKTVCVDEPYTYTKCVVDTVPVKRTRKVAKCIEEDKVVTVTKCIPVVKEKEVTVKKCVTVMETRQQCVRKRVQVPCDPCVSCNPC